MLEFEFEEDEEDDGELEEGKSYGLLLWCAFNFIPFGNIINYYLLTFNF